MGLGTVVALGNPNGLYIDITFQFVCGMWCHTITAAVLGKDMLAVSDPWYPLMLELSSGKRARGQLEAQEWSLHPYHEYTQRKELLKQEYKLRRCHHIPHILSKTTNRHRVLIGIMEEDESNVSSSHIISQLTTT